MIGPFRQVLRHLHQTGVPCRRKGGGGAYWLRVHSEAVTKAHALFSLHRGKIFTAAFMYAVSVAWAMWKADVDKATSIVTTIALWLGAWFVVYVYHFLRAPSRFDTDRRKTIERLEEEISRRKTRTEAAQKLIAIYERGLVIGANPENLEHRPWMNRYTQWKEEVERALKPISEVELWMFRTIGDGNLFGLPTAEREQFLMMFHELKEKRNKLRLIISRTLPKDDPQYAAMAGKEEI